MRHRHLVLLTLSAVLAACASDPSDTRARSDAAQEQKAAEWVAALHLDDPAREARLRAVITAHLKAVRDWHNEHPYTTVPAGINPVTGKQTKAADFQGIGGPEDKAAIDREVRGGDNDIRSNIRQGDETVRPSGSLSNNAAGGAGKSTQ